MTTPIRRLFLASNIEGNAKDVFEQLFDGSILMADYPGHLNSNDVVIFDGGTDVNPRLYGEAPHPFTQTPNQKRDEIERRFFRKAQAAGAACIGVCRGAQFLNVLSGGKLIQHVDGHGNGVHPVLCKSMLGDYEVHYDAVGDHHQMMYPYNIHFDMIGYAVGQGTISDEYEKELPDGKEPEIIWIPDTRSLCIQPHPEWMESYSPFVNYCRELVKRYIFGQQKPTLS